MRWISHPRGSKSDRREGSNLDRRIHVTSPDIEGLSYNNATNISEYFYVANELVNKQLSSNNPMNEASDY